MHPVRPKPTTYAKTKPRTVMVWMAGDNNLEAAGREDFKEMMRVGTGADVNVVAQFDRTSGNNHTLRYEVAKGSLKKTADLGPTNTGDPRVAADFFTWGIQNYPAERLLAVIWNHGSGIDETDIYALARALGQEAGR